MAMQTQAVNMATVEDRESEAAAAAVEHPPSEEGSDGSAAKAGEAAVQEAKDAVEANGQALQALIIAKLGEYVDVAKMGAENVEEVNADVAKAVSEAAFEEQV